MRDKIALYWHTLRHLKPVQFYGRVWFRLARPRPDLREIPAARHCCGAWQKPARRRHSMTGPAHFVFLNHRGDLQQHGWNSPEQSLLWIYNQHYFDDLNAEDSDQRVDWHRDLIERWITDNMPSIGPGWAPYPTSLRIVNWIKWANAGNNLSDVARQSLAIQTRWLRKRLEWHLLGNHLFANAKALIFAGAWFEGPEAQRWLEHGARILADQIPEQVLPDGGQFELSPMYHALAVEDMLDLLNVLEWSDKVRVKPGARIVALIRERLPAMLDWLATMLHTDGEVAFFNDTAIGIAPTPTEIMAYASRLGFQRPPETQTLLPDSGYVRLQNNDAVVIADVAAVGPDYLPGHAHADTLSCEISVFSQRVIVNSGTSVYGNGPERLRQRGTAAHSTVVIDASNSSEVWGGFRVARRARITHREFSGKSLRAAHDGYKRLAGAPQHTRSWELSENELVIRDEVSPARPAMARYHIHPEVKITQEKTFSGALHLPGGQKINWKAKADEIAIEDGSWHPEFGLSHPNKCLALRCDSGTCYLAFDWS